MVVLCGKTQVEQANALGMSPRHFARLIRLGWEDWNVGTAERWCSFCGVDFFDMDISKKLSAVRWRKLTPVLQRALRGILRMATGKEPTQAQVRALASQLEPHG
jgi:hypothetical protein